MPIDGESGLEGILGSAETGAGGQPGQQTQDDAGQANLLTQTPERESGQQLLAGKYKSPEELEKAYLSSQKAYGQKAGRLSQIEKLLSDPKFHALAAQDPEMADALGKLGYSLRQEEESQSKGEGEWEWDGNENDPRFQIEVARQEFSLFREQNALEKRLKRELTAKELSDIKGVIRMNGSLTFAEAWKLTPHFDKEQKSAEDRRVAELTKRFQPANRPKPNQTVLPGEKLDLKKPVTEMNESERRAFIAQLIEKGQQ